MPEYYDELIETAIHLQNADTKNKKANSAPLFFKSGKRIVYGDTGMKTNHYVGSEDEKLYFKVKFMAGDTVSEGETLFYDNPRDFCVHYFTKLSKKKFLKNNDYAFIQDRVDAMLNEMSATIDEWKTRRDVLLQKYSQNQNFAGGK